MAGGIWTSQNKLRPGAYINFENESAVKINIGERGIATMPISLDWGGENSLIELTSEDLLTGKSLAKVGLVYTDADALLIKLALQNCKLLKVFNINSGGVKATKTIGYTETYELTSDVELVSGKTYYTRSGSGTEESPYVYTPVAEPDVSDIATYYEKIINGGVTVTAKYPGLFGNKIAIVINTSENGYIVDTYANGYSVDSQEVSNATELVNNEFVDFSNATGALVPTASTLLAGGTNGQTVTNYLTNYFNALLSTSWNTMAVPSNDVTIQLSVINFIKSARDEEGKYVQAVLPNVDIASADYEGIINSVNGVVLTDGTTVSAVNFVAWIAGATAGAANTESLTGKVVDNATSITNMLSNSEIVTGLQNGKFILSRNQNGAIKVEKDINSLHTFTAEKNYTFSKNRIIRELDEIGSSIENIWETTFLGKVNNNDDGRTLFKSSIIDYLTNLQTLGAISDFDSESVTVEAGDDVDSVIATIAVKPIDSMELLYMTVSVS